MSSPVTVLVPTSTIPSHPDMSRVDHLVRHVRQYPALADAEILFLVDGLRAEQAERSPDYEEYKQRLIWRCIRDPAWHSCLPIVFDAWQHQGCMARRAMEQVKTPLALWCEHDMWPIGEIPWAGFFAALQRPDVNSIRLYLQPTIIDAHRHLYPGYPTPEIVEGVPLLRTKVWSGNVHLAKADWYRWLLDTFFGWESRTYLEEVLYYARIDRVAQGIDSEDRWGTWIYFPDEGNLQRSETHDGREQDQKFSRVIAYDGPTPKGAPQPRRYV